MSPAETKRDVPPTPDAYWREQDRMTLQILQPEIYHVRATYFPAGKPMLLNHQGWVRNPDGFTPAREYLADVAEVPTHLLDEVFTQSHISRHPLKERRLVVPGGDLVQLPDDGVDIYALPPAEIARYMARQLAPLYELNTPSLDSVFPFGFNIHDLGHVWQVYRDAQYLLGIAQPQRSDIDETTYTINAAASLDHDAANGAAGRFRHSLEVNEVLAKRLPQITRNEALWERLQIANALHDEPVLKIFLGHYGALKENGKIDIDNAIPVLEQHARPEAIAVLAADKRQDGRDREPRKTQDRKSLADDQNNLTAMLLNREETPHISPDGKTYTFRLNFTSQIDPNGPFAWAGKSSTRLEYFPGGQRVFVPPSIHRPWRDKKIPYSLSTEQTWFDLYYNHQDRFAALVASTFALFPKLMEFRIDIPDPLQPETLDPAYKQQLEEARVFHRGRVEQDIAHYENVLMNPITRKTA